MSLVAALLGLRIRVTSAGTDSCQAVADPTVPRQRFGTTCCQGIRPQRSNDEVAGDSRHRPPISWVPWLEMTRKTRVTIRRAQASCECFVDERLDCLGGLFRTQGQ